MTFTATGFPRSLSGSPREDPLYEAHHIIDGQEVTPVPGGAFERRGPVSDTVVSRAPAGRADAARDAATAAAAAFPAWADTAPGDRIVILECAASLMEASVEEVVGIACAEVGSSPDWVRFNVTLAAGMLRQTAEFAEALTADAQRIGPHVLRRRPAGVVLGIAPWNAAVTLATRAVAAPLACGNTVVLKGSELCPKTHEWVAGIVNSAGLPKGVLNYITNAPDHAEEVVEALIGHPAIRRVNFTGSTRVGREIAVTAARHLKPCLLELSGKGTLIVLADADLDAAAKAAAHGSFFNQGQICMSTERILIEDGIADAFVTKFRAEAEELRFRTGEAPLGALISPSAAVRIGSIVEDALARGATLVTGGELAGGGIQPTILDHVTPGMRLYTEEAFGPIAGIVRVGDRDEALSVANDTDYGLVTSIFTADEDAALTILGEIETGIGHVNGSTVHDDPSMPFGGMKASGYGRFGGLEAIREFTECQWVSVHDAVGAVRPDQTDVL